MSGLDEVEEWLRERTFLLQALKEATDQILQFYMKQPDRAVMEGNGEVQNLIDRYLAILDYKRKSTTPGIWVVLQKANIPGKLVKPTKDWEFARRAVAFLLNTHVNEILCYYYVEVERFFGLSNTTTAARDVHENCYCIDSR